MIRKKRIKNESEFKRWFMKNYKKFGYSEIVRKDIGKFPDFIMMKDGKDVRVELETIVSNFLRHKHPLDKVDEIICIVNDVGFEIPVIVAEELQFIGSGKLKVTLSIDNEVYNTFQKFCEENALIISKKIELMIREALKKTK